MLKKKSKKAQKKEENEKLYLKDIIMSYKRNEYLFTDNFEKFYNLTKKITKKQDCILCLKNVKIKNLTQLMKKALYNRYSTNTDQYQLKKINSFLKKKSKKNLQMQKENLLEKSGEEFFKRIYKKKEYNFKFQNLYRFHQFNIYQPRFFLNKIFILHQKYYQMIKKRQERGIRRMLDNLTDSQLEKKKIDLDFYINQKDKIYEVPKKMYGSKFILRHFFGESFSIFFSEKELFDVSNVTRKTSKRELENEISFLKDSAINIFKNPVFDIFDSKKNVLGNKCDFENFDDFFDKENDRGNKKLKNDFFKKKIFLKNKNKYGIGNEKKIGVNKQCFKKKKFNFKNKKQEKSKERYIREDKSPLRSQRMKTVKNFNFKKNKNCKSLETNLKKIKDQNLKNFRKNLFKKSANKLEIKFSKNLLSSRKKKKS